MASESVAEQANREFTALLTKADVRKLETTAGSFGINRRIAAYSLTRTKQQLSEHMDATRVKVLWKMQAEIADYREHLDNMREMANAALARIFVVLEDVARNHPELEGMELDA